jgi:beta-lactamase class A
MMRILAASWALGVGVCAPGGLRATLDSLARSIDGRIGTAVTVIESGETVSVRGTGRFPMQSVYKLPIAMVILSRVDRGLLRLDQLVPVDSADIAPVHSPITERYPKGGVTLTIRELVRGAIVESDGTASDVLLKLVPASAVTAYVRSVGAGGMNIVATEKEMARDSMVQYRNWATPAAAVALLRALQEGRRLTASSRGLLMAWLIETGTGAARLKGLLPPGTVVAHKTGTDRTSGGLTRATNDIGVITLPDGRHVAIAVFVSDSRADEAAREGVIAAMAQAVWRCHTEPHT